MAKPPKNSSVIVQRRRDSVALPPCTLGFASLVEPDTYDPDKPMFKLDAHYTPAGIEALKLCIQKECIDANLDKLREEMEGNPGLKAFAKAEPQSPEAWLAGKLKEPKEKSKIQLPKIVIAVKADYKDRAGDTKRRSVGVWDRHNKALDLKALKLGMGSIIQPIVNPNLFFSKLIGFPQPHLSLVGVRIHKLERFGGARPPQETDEDDIREVLGEAFVADDDLSAFAAGGASLPGADPEAPSADDTVGGAF